MKDKIVEKLIENNTALVNALADLNEITRLKIESDIESKRLESDLKLAEIKATQETKRRAMNILLESGMLDKAISYATNGLKKGFVNGTDKSDK